MFLPRGQNCNTQKTKTILNLHTTRPDKYGGGMSTEGTTVIRNVGGLPTDGIAETFCVARCNTNITRKHDTVQLTNKLLKFT